MLFQKKHVLWILSIVIVLCVAIFFLTHEVSVVGFQQKMAAMTIKEKMQYAKKIVKKQPKSEAALYATLVYLQVRDENGKRLDVTSQVSSLKHILKYHPESTEVLLSLASLTQTTSPKESIDYAKQVLRSEPLHLDGHSILGAMYQELGDYKTGLIYFKKAKKLLDAKTDEPHTHEPHTHGAHPHSSVGVDFQVEIEGETRVLSADELSDYHLSRNIKAIEDGTPLFGPGIKEHSKEFRKFLLWLKVIEHAKSPAELENILMREMALHLQGKRAAFEIERLITAYETLEQHGETEGIKRLQNIDPDLASAVKNQ